jgi:hypothetical protein
MESQQLQYFTRKEINDGKWNRCIDDASNGLIYGYSFYLDRMSENWDALVLNDYEAVMPLTWKIKFGLSYLYQPPFAASLGIFGNHLNEKLLISFLESIPSRFKVVDISLNHQNHFLDNIPGMVIRKNYILDLNKPYEEIVNGYRENIRRNIKKARQLNCSWKTNIPLDLILPLAKVQMKTLSDFSDEDFENFRNLCSILLDQGKAVTYGVFTSRNELVASAVYFFSHRRAYYILVGNHPNGKTLGASHFLIDRFIHDNAGKGLFLDFEGSDIRNLAFFYSSFGAIEEQYPAYYRNRLPWFMRWLKKSS